MKIRTLLKAASIISVALPAGYAAAEGELTVVSWGGALQAAQRTAWFDPVEKELNITVKEDTVNGIADVRTQVQSGNVTWDLVELGSNSCVKLAEEGAVEPLDLSMIDTANIDQALRGDAWSAVLIFSTVLAWNTDSYPDGGPQNWADMWDTEKFPGVRSMYRKPYYNLEVALMADGVAPQDLYPLDVERAFAKLEELKPDVVTWWPSGRPRPSC